MYNTGISYKKKNTNIHDVPVDKEAQKRDYEAYKFQAEELREKGDTIGAMMIDKLVRELYLLRSIYTKKSELD